MEGKYKVVTLCGSTKFKDEFMRMQKELTLKGCIVLSVGCFSHSGDVMTNEQKIMLDEMHKRKIDMADEIFVINKNGYIGASTRSEIEYAKKSKKPIHYLEKKHTYTAYSEKENITFIMEDLYEAGEKVNTEVKGWYYGKIDEDVPNSYYDNIKATNRNTLGKMIKDLDEGDFFMVGDYIFRIIRKNKEDVMTKLWLSWNKNLCVYSYEGDVNYNNSEIKKYIDNEIMPYIVRHLGENSLINKHTEIRRVTDNKLLYEVNDSVRPATIEEISENMDLIIKNNTISTEWTVSLANQSTIICINQNRAYGMNPEEMCYIKPICFLSPETKVYKYNPK